MADNVAESWADYESALDQVFPAATGGRYFLTEGRRDEPTPEAVDRLIEASDELHRNIAATTDTPDRDQRELARLQFMSGAAMDIDSANRLLEAVAFSPASGDLELLGPRPQTSGGLLSADDHAQLAEILSTAPADKNRVLGNPAPSPLSLLLGESQPVDAAAFKKDVTTAIDGIVEDSSNVASKALAGLLAIPAQDVIDKLLTPIAEALDNLLGAKLRFWVNKAAQLVRRGVDKLLALFGLQEGTVLKKVGEWISKLGTQKVTSQFFIWAFGVTEISNRLDQEIDSKASAVPPGALDKAASDLSNLSGRLHKQMSILSKVEWVLGKASHWVVGAAPPWGLIAMISSNGLVCGYAVYAGQDYLDWREDDVFDRVEGVQHTVDNALTPP